MEFAASTRCASGKERIADDLSTTRANAGTSNSPTARDHGRSNSAAMDQMSDDRFHDPDFASTALDESPARPTWVRYQVLATACSLAVITYIHRVGFATASAEFKKPLGLSDQHLGYMMAAFMIGYGLFEIPWGFLGDRFGVRNILAAIILGGSTLTACLALVAFLPRNVLLIVSFLVVLRFLFGAFQAGTFPSISRMMADWMPTTERGSAQGTIWMSSRMGGALAPLLLVWLFAAMGDWKMPLVLVAVLGLAWCALVLAVVSQPPGGDAAGQPRGAKADRGRPGRRAAARATATFPGPGC